VPASPDTFLVTSDGIGAIGIDYVDLGTEPDEDVIYAFVLFTPRLEPGTVIWAPGLTPPRGIVLDPVRARFAPEDGKLRTIVGEPRNEKQLVTVTGTPFTLTPISGGPTTANIAQTATPAQVQAALEALANIDVGDVFVSGATVNEKQTITIGGGATGGTFPLAFNGSDPIPELGRNSTASLVKAALQSLSTIGSGGVSVTGPTGGPWVVEFTGPLAGADQPLITTSAANLTGGTPTAGVTETVKGSTGNPFTVTFQGQYEHQDMALMAATNATITAAQEGTSDLGVKLVANTALLALDDLIYDVEFDVPDDEFGTAERILKPFAIAAPETTGVTLDLATVAKLPHRSQLGI
jgi:hypothetical protein